MSVLQTLPGVKKKSSHLAPLGLGNLPFGPTPPLPDVGYQRSRGAKMETL